jgi:hypothetical protein
MSSHLGDLTDCVFGQIVTHLQEWEVGCLSMTSKELRMKTLKRGRLELVEDSSFELILSHLPGWKVKVLSMTNKALRVKTLKRSRLEKVVESVFDLIMSKLNLAEAMCLSKASSFLRVKTKSMGSMLFHVNRIKRFWKWCMRFSRTKGLAEAFQALQLNQTTVTAMG